MKEPVILAGVSLLFVLGSLGALAGLVLTEPLLTLDGITLLAVCLLLAGVFSAVAVSFLKDAKQDAKKEAAESRPAPAGGEKPA